ncbi:MAG: c-type cytochrome domain-containing protein [Verrucomicrobiia bacterium]
MSGKCFACHGPDEKERKAKLRLDMRESAIADHGGIRARPQWTF